MNTFIRQGNPYVAHLEWKKTYLQTVMPILHISSQQKNWL